jgi:hypothetical protein
MPRQSNGRVKGYRPRHGIHRKDAIRARLAILEGMAIDFSKRVFAGIKEAMLVRTDRLGKGIARKW